MTARIKCANCKAESFLGKQTRIYCPFCFDAQQVNCKLLLRHLKALFEATGYTEFKNAEAALKAEYDRQVNNETDHD